MDNIENLINIKGSETLIKIAVPILDLLNPIKYSPNKKYDNKYFFTCILDFLNTHVSWNKYKGVQNYPISGKYLNQIHNKYIACGAYDEINKQMLNKYLKKGKETKLKHQIIDSTFIANKQGSVKNNNNLLSQKSKQKNKKIRRANKLLPKNKRIKEETFIDFNRYNGRKKYLKISSITDSMGTPLSIDLVSSKQSDNVTVKKTIKKIPVELNTLKNSKINRYKQSLLADSGYDSLKNTSYLTSLGYTPRIAWNRRGTKNPKIIKRNKATEQQKKIYKKRVIIESFFSWMKNYPVINQNYQKTLKSYLGLVLLAASLIISKRV